ncbi:hypothetical protein GQ42DRAFT_156152 [Ramicandelaber brevisporus]|nr:hypothetical protein GQ42DRAFT_156152 [Ramicandelaber brevisporus]
MANRLKKAKRTCDIGGYDSALVIKGYLSRPVLTFSKDHPVTYHSNNNIINSSVRTIDKVTQIPAVPLTRHALYDTRHYPISQRCEPPMSSLSNVGQVHNVTLDGEKHQEIIDEYGPPAIAYIRCAVRPYLGDMLKRTDYDLLSVQLIEFILALVMELEECAELDYDSMASLIVYPDSNILVGSDHGVNPKEWFDAVFFGAPLVMSAGEYREARGIYDEMTLVKSVYHKDKSAVIELIPFVSEFMGGTIEQVRSIEQVDFGTCGLSRLNNKELTALVLNHPKAKLTILKYYPSYDTDDIQLKLAHELVSNIAKYLALQTTTDGCNITTLDFNKPPSTLRIGFEDTVQAIQNAHKMLLQQSAIFAQYEYDEYESHIDHIKRFRNKIYSPFTSKENKNRGISFAVGNGFKGLKCRMFKCEDSTEKMGSYFSAFYLTRSKDDSTAGKRLRCDTCDRLYPRDLLSSLSIALVGHQYVYRNQQIVEGKKVITSQNDNYRMPGFFAS